MTLNRDEIEKIELYINGEANDLEKEFVEALFLEGENNLYLRKSLEKDWTNILNDDTANEVELSHLLDRIHHTIRKNESLRMRKPIQKFIRIYSKVAAVFLIPLLLAGGLFYSFFAGRFQITANKNVSAMIYAPPGSRVSFNLPDGTKGMLNGGSQLEYTMPFADNRRIKLVGEAWLEVKHDEKHPFFITAANSMVKVVGTNLNLSTYPNEDYIEIVLQNGKVVFTGKDGDQEITMKPSDRLVFENGQTNKTVVDPAKYNAWTEGKLVFRSDPMAEVARRIERWYNVKIILADRELDKYTFRATFQDDKIEDVLKFLAMTSPITYKIKPRKLMPDGTFQKEEITIYNKN